MRKKNDVKITLRRDDARKLDKILQFVFDQNNVKVDLKRQADVRFRARHRFVQEAVAHAIVSVNAMINGELPPESAMGDFIRKMPVN